MQSISEIHATARAYAEAGIPVFPCEAGGKRPITENGFKDSTTDLTIIDNWWQENPDYNLAICPDYAGLFVVDIDPGADDLSFPPTYEVRTPRGGKHLYFEGSGKTSASKIAPHIDTRGVGGYVLVPPSSVNGQPYTLEHETGYFPIPEWISTALAVVDQPLAAATEEKDLPGNIERALKVLRAAVQRKDVAIEGQGGDDRTYRMCCELLDLGLSPHVAKDLMLEPYGWNEACQPPWSDDDLEIKFENAMRFMQNEGGAYAVEPPQAVFGDVVKNLFPSDNQKSRFYFKDESEIDSESDPTWIIKDLISERSTVMMFGASGSYKSFLALDICLSVATGMATFGSDTKQGLVFYGALEGRAHLKKARKAWRVMRGIQGKINNFFVGMAPMIGVEGEIQEFGDQIKERCGGMMPTLIVIDTLSKSMAGLNENDAQDAGKFIRFCDSLVEAFGCSVLAIHHTGKEENRGARGSSAFLAGFDTVLEVKAHKATKAVSVFVRKHKDAEEKETPWTFEGRMAGASLAFEATTPDQHRLLTGDTKDLSPKAVGTALKKLSAFGEANAVTTAVLSTEITPARENESVEDRAGAIARTGRALNAEAHDSLEGYCLKQGKNRLWCLPAPE